MYKALFSLVCITYKTILRDLLIKAINDPDEEWDELVLTMLDGLFCWKPDK